MHKRLRRDGKNRRKNCAKNVLMQIITMVTRLETDILECEVKWV